jgi:hypothetical protein
VQSSVGTSLREENAFPLKCLINEGGQGSSRHETVVHRQSYPVGS